MGVYEFRILTIYKSKTSWAPSYCEFMTQSGAEYWNVNLNRVELRAFFSDLLGVIIRGLVDLQQPGGLSQRPQSFDGIRALKVLLLQPLLQVTNVTSAHRQTLGTSMIFVITAATEVMFLLTFRK